MSRSYLTPKRLADLERSLAPRERAIIETLDRLRVATTNQLRRLHFHDLTPRSAARQAPKQLAALATHQLVVKLDHQVGGVRAGSQAAIWSLDVAGQKLASASGPAGGPVRRPWTPSLDFLAHRLAVSECYVNLTERCRTDAAAELISFDAEPLCWRRFASTFGGMHSLKPDAFVRLGVGDLERGAFIEVDRATEGRAALTKKLRAYRQYWEVAAAREERRWGYFPKVVFAVPDAARKAVLVDLCAAQPEETQPLWRVVLADDLTAALIGGGP